MSDHAIADPCVLGFFKLVVSDLERMVSFYETAFAFGVRDRVDLPNMEEAMLVLPGQKFNLVLCRWKDGRKLTIGNGHGPVGLITRDIDSALARAVESGASTEMAPTSVGADRVAFIIDPEGHQIELIQFNAL
jgi:lactoylglutathione lyase